MKLGMKAFGLNGVLFLLALVANTGMAASQIASWGGNIWSELGNGLSGIATTPQPILDIGPLNGKTITQINSSCAVTSEGKAICWGDNDFGQVGNGSTLNTAVPAAVSTSGLLAGKTATQISSGPRHSCLLTNEGRVYCWGLNDAGQLGNGNTTNSSVPVEVETKDALSGKIVTQVTAGLYHSCALTSEGKAYCWGENWAGQLGNGTNTDSNVPVAVDATGLLSGKTITQISVGNYHSCALTSEGITYCWGGNDVGELGDGTANSSTVPIAVVVSGGLSGKTVNTISSGFYHTCAGTNDGRVYCWGGNYNGQLGDGTSSHSNIPVAVVASGVLSGKLVTQISGGAQHTCVRTVDGLAYCWGWNDTGQLGNGTNMDSSVPVAVNTSGVLAGKTVTEVSVGAVHSCARTSDNLVFC